MSNIYKLNHIQNNETKHIYVFTGGLEYEGIDYGPLGTKFFTIQEWTNIKQTKIPITIVPHFIHADDTISVIKKKLLNI